MSSSCRSWERRCGRLSRVDGLARKYNLGCTDMTRSRKLKMQSRGSLSAKAGFELESCWVEGYLIWIVSFLLLHNINHRYPPVQRLIMNLRPGFTRISRHSGEMT